MCAQWNFFLSRKKGIERSNPVREKEKKKIRREREGRTFLPLRVHTRIGREDIRKREVLPGEREIKAQKNSEREGEEKREGKERTGKRVEKQEQEETPPYACTHVGGEEEELCLSQWIRIFITSERYA